MDVLKIIFLTFSNKVHILYTLRLRSTSEVFFSKKNCITSKKNINNQIDKIGSGII